MIGLTEKQAQILRIIVQLNPDGTFVDLDELLERLPYKPTKDALQFSLRFMIRKGLIEKKELEFRRGAKRRVLAATLEGYKEFRALRRV